MVEEIYTRYIECPQCGMTEEMDIDSARNDCQTFTFLEFLDNGEGKYKCPFCNSEVISSTELELEEYHDYEDNFDYEKYKKEQEEKGVYHNPCKNCKGEDCPCCDYGNGY